jgi:Fe-S-cluster-containing hydrogenase component 2
MVPNRRLREELARAERARSRRSREDSQVTVVPMDDPVVADSRHDSLVMPSQEIEIVGASIDSRQDPTIQTPMPHMPKTVSLDESDLDWAADEEQTRIDPPSDPMIEVHEVEEIYEVGDHRSVKSERTTLRRPDRGDEKSVVRRFLDSVITAVPRAVKKAVGAAPKTAEAPSGRPRARSQEAREPSRAPKAQPKIQIDQRAWREMRTAAIFDGLPNEALRDALLSGDARVLRLERDSLVPTDGALVLVRTGQIALAQFSSDVLKTEREAAAKVTRAGGKLDKKERNRRTKQGPMIRLADKNLATFEDGDVVETAVAASEHGSLACYAVTPVTVITIARQRADLWRRVFPFMSDRFRRAAATARARLDATDGAKALVADFFIRHGLSVSMTLRVRKLDACIECGACEQACEDRYGAKRLSLNGRILGGLDFVDACHTCTDQRCIDPCNFDAIRFDVERKEVLINEANCTGCTLCATACPYDAIEMHELDDKPLLKLRLDKSGALAFGDGTPRKARLRRIASKCDHCAFYADQACVSACPTGALIEVLPQDVVSTLPDQARATAKAGFDRTTAIDVRKLNETSAFVKGLDKLPELGRARAPRAKILMGLWWTLGLLALTLAGLEIVLRKYFPSISLQYWLMTRVDGLDPDLALGRVDFRPGCELAVNLGYAGTAVMISGMAYVWRRRIGFMRNWGSLRAWFDWHVMTGVVGPAFILMHSAAKLDNWVSLAFWSMILTVISGLLGRYLTTELPEKASTALVETLEVDRKLAELRAQHPGVRVADGWFEGYRRRVAQWEKRLGKDKKPTFFGAVLTFLWVARDDVMRGQRLRALNKALKAAVRSRAVRKQTMRYAQRLALLERRRVLLPRLEPLFSQWKAVHVPMAITLTIIAALHITLALRAG